MASLIREFDSESAQPTSNYASRSNTNKSSRLAGFNGLIKPLATIHGPGQAGPWIDRWLDSMFRKEPLRSETRLAKN
jgi:hypothetical protein